MRLDHVKVGLIILQRKTIGLYVRIRFVLGTAPSHVSIPLKSEWPDGQRQINEAGKCIREKNSLKNEIQRWRPSSGVPRDCVNRIRLLAASA